MARPSRKEQDANTEAGLRLKKWEIVADAVHLGIPWGAFVIIFGFVAYMVSHIAGKTTLAQIGMSFIGDIRISDAVAYIFGGSGFAYGLNERRLRHKKTASMAGYSALLETKIHPGRTSSGLTPKGTTRKEDKL